MTVQKSPFALAAPAALAAMLLAFASFLPAPLQAAGWKPDGALRLQVGFGAGGGTDTLARAIARSIEQNTDWEVVVENKPGGGGVAMFSNIVRMKPDGGTIGMGVSVATLMNLALRGDKLPFKADSFDYLATVVLAPLSIVAKADAPFDTFAEFVAHAKSAGGGLIGFDAKPQEMMMRAVDKTAQAGFKLVSHKSGAEIIQSILGGHVDIGFGAGAHIKYLDSKDLKMLAVATQTRHAYSPGTETLIEQGFEYSVEPYFYLAAPKGLSAEAKRTLAAVLDEAINSAAVGEVIGNVMITVPTNLGPDGTEDKLVNGLDSIKYLVKAAQ